jgi:hypothetical protein
VNDLYLPDMRQFSPMNQNVKVYITCVNYRVISLSIFLLQWITGFKQFTIVEQLYYRQKFQSSSNRRMAIEKESGDLRLRVLFLGQPPRTWEPGKHLCTRKREIRESLTVSCLDRRIRTSWPALICKMPKCH